jgi:hypothetical protein
MARCADGCGARIQLRVDGGGSESHSAAHRTHLHPRTKPLSHRPLRASSGTQLGAKSRLAGQMQRRAVGVDVAKPPSLDEITVAGVDG